MINTKQLATWDSGDELYAFPASFPQKQIWFLDRLDPGNPAYNIPFAYDVKGKLNCEAIEKSINEIIRRHETFRSVFNEDEAGLVQIVSPSLKINIPVVDLSNDSDKQEKAKQIIDKECTAPFDLTEDALVRGYILKFDDDNFTLVLNFHHIILDHISIVQFADELKTLYENYSQGQNSTLIEPELHYADYAVWQKEHQTPENISSKVSYWKEHLTGKPDFLDLPIDFARPSIQTMHGAEYHLSFPKDLTEKLKTLSRNESVSMYITLITGYAITMHRYSKQDVVSVGTPFANRGHQPELDKVMGCFINTIPVVADFEGDPTFRDVLKSVRKNVFAASANQEAPFEMIVEALQPKRDPSYNPIFQVGFTFQEPPMEIELRDCDVKSQRLHNKSAKFDLHSWLWDTDDGIRGTIEYNTDLYTHETLERFARHYQSILEAAVKNIDLPVSRLNISSDEERDRLLLEWNQTHTEFNSVKSIHGLFEAQVEQQADKVAAICNGQQITYTELNQRANQLAQHLINNGVSGNALIAVCVERSVDMLVATLGVLKAGACYIPVDPEYPQDRVNYMLENSASKVIISQSQIADNIGFPDTVQQILLDNDKTSIDACSTEAPNVTLGEKDLAYIIYTSGSTGKPKGVMVPQSTAANFLSSMAQTPGFSQNDRLLAVTTLSFDIAVLELYLPLSTGGQVIIATREEVSDGEDLDDLIDEHDITVMQATPATWRLLLSANWEGKNDLKVLCGGEALPRDLLHKLLPLIGELWNMYGPTETTVWSTCQQITDADAPIFIGRPIANTQCYIVDAHMQLSPIGVPGELLIGGEGVTQGYLGLTEMTQDRFIDNPFNTDDAYKLYRTGDLVKYRPDGQLEYIQRIDNQVKVRGFRIELGEIESVLAKQEEIKQAVVVVREERAGDPRLVAYIVPEDHANITTTSIRNELRKDLPDYMLPQHIVEMDELPLTPNGKIDRKALPAPFTQAESQERVAPETAAEKLISKIWSEVLEMPEDQFGALDNFFDIGGHSLSSMQVITRLNPHTQEKTHPRELILNNLRQLAEQINLKDQATTDQMSSEESQSTNEATDKAKNTGGVKSLFGKLFGR